MTEHFDQLAHYRTMAADGWSRASAACGQLAAAGADGRRKYGGMQQRYAEAARRNRVSADEAAQSSARAAADEAAADGAMLSEMERTVRREAQDAAEFAAREEAEAAGQSARAAEAAVRRGGLEA